MKNKQLRNRHQLKQERAFRRFVLFSLGSIIGVIVLWAMLENQKPPGTSRPDIERYIRSSATKEMVSPGRVAALIYYKNVENGQEGFLCTGTIFSDTNAAAQIITAEHIFRNDLRDRHIFKVVPLNGTLELNGAELPYCYMDRIVKTSRELGGKDAVIATISTNPVVFGQFSHYVYEEMGQSYWTNGVTIGKARIPTLRSIVSGEVVKTIGYYQPGTDTNVPLCIIADRLSYSGESGTGFVDDRDGLWVLHATPATPELRRQICEECEQMSGQKISSVVTLSGPFGGHYDD